MRFFGFYIVCFIIGSFTSSAQSNSIFLEIPYSNTKLKVDGKLDDWENFAEYFFSDTIHSFINTTGQKLNDLYPPNFQFGDLLLPKSKNKIRFRAFWNHSNFCIAVTVWDKHFFAQNRGRIDKPMVHLNDGIEIYIDTKNECTEKMDVNDYQFLIDIKNENEVFKGDLKEILADTVAVPKNFAQNILFYSAVDITGTINDDIEDGFYTVELVIPFAAIGVAPETNMKMGLDVCINDIDYPDSLSNRIEEASTAMWPFSWSGYSDFGYPKFWKKIIFTGSPSWYEIISEKYKEQWFWIYTITLLISFFVILYLAFRTVKLRRLPSAKEIKEKELSAPVKSGGISYNRKLLKNAEDYITEHKSENIHSEELAENLGLSLRKLQRITRGELNVTPTNFICIIKLRLAAEYLKNKSGNITDAAYEFGFSDPSYFSKSFKKHFEISPTDFVKKITE